MMSAPAIGIVALALAATLAAWNDGYRCGKDRAEYDKAMRLWTTPRGEAISAAVILLIVLVVVLDGRT